MRVLVVVKGLGLGGAERLLVDQVLAGHGGAVAYTVAHVRSDKTHFTETLERAGVEVVTLGGSAPWPVALARVMRRTRPDVVHSHSPLPAAVARVLVRAGAPGRRRAHVYTEHNRWSAYRRPTRAVNAATMVLDRVVWSVSEEARSSIRPAWLRRRGSALHHGIDLQSVRAAATTPGAPSADAACTTFVHVANRRPAKAHEVLLDAFARAVAEEADLRLWLVGQGLGDAELVALVDGHPARSRIEVLGYRSDVPALMARADALVLSSDHEGLPVAVMEAMALARPVVATRVGGIPEAVRDGSEGLLVAPRDPAALAAAMVTMHRDQDLRTRMGRAAAQRAEMFEASVSQGVLEGVYCELGRSTPAG
ncbi:glycosyltransferase [soil metagenome]